MKVLKASLTIVCLLAGGSLAAADDCRRSHGGIIDIREGQHNTGFVPFKFESRVQRYSEFARKYTWCVENLAKYQSAEFAWGSAGKIGKYFRGIIGPGKMTPNIITDASEIMVAPGTITVTPLNGSSPYTVDSETISNQRMGSNRSRLRLAEARKDQSPFYAIMSVEALSNSPTSLRAAVSKYGKIEFYSQTLLTVPANKEAQLLIRKREYSTYRESDFVRMELSLYNTIASAKDGQPVSTLLAIMKPVSSRELVDNAMKAVPLRVSLSPSSSDIKFGQGRLAELQRNVFDSAHYGTVELATFPAANLSSTEVTVTISAADGDDVYAVLPARVLLPAK